MISDLYSDHKPVSFEVFPPKKEADTEGLRDILKKLAGFGPDFISVTHGAGGSGSTDKTLDTAAFIQNDCRVTALAHLTCSGSTKEKVTGALAAFNVKGVKHILALRGDLSPDKPASPDYSHASDLLADIRDFGGFCAGAACYPEGHSECDDIDIDMRNLLLKQEAGAGFLITQLFFDNDVFFRFIEKALAIGLTLPVSAGVMPILSRSQVEKMIYLCGASLPAAIVKLLHKYENDPESLRKAGIERAATQAADLLERGADGVHIYTMNKPEIAERCVNEIRG